jgi:hypothetical protein
MPPVDPTNPPKWAGFTRRLGYWLFGLALGFMILGFYNKLKQNQARLDEERRQQLLSQPPPKDNLFPPIPRDQPAPAPGTATTPSPAAPSK